MSNEDHIMLADGFLWTSGGPDTDDHLSHDPHEAILEPVMRGLLGSAPGKVFVDIGAHVGRWAIRLTDIASHVYAVEANPATAETLRRNIELNHLESKVSVICCAAWDSETVLRLEDPNGKHRGGSTRVLEQDGNIPDGFRTPAYPLDTSTLRKHTDIGLVKIDVEGADLHVLRGMRRVLSVNRPIMLIERHDQYGYYRAEELDELLTSLGYYWQPAPRYMDEQHIICFWRG